MLTTLSTLLRTKVKTPEAAKAAKDISLRRKPVYQGCLLYTSEDRLYHIDPETAPIVQEIFTRYADGEPAEKIAASLDVYKRQPCTPCGWTPAARPW